MMITYQNRETRSAIEYGAEKFKLIKKPFFSHRQKQIIEGLFIIWNAKSPSQYAILNTNEFTRWYKFPDKNQRNSSKNRKVIKNKQFSTQMNFDIILDDFIFLACGIKAWRTPIIQFMFLIHFSSLAQYQNTLINVACLLFFVWLFDDCNVEWIKIKRKKLNI